MVHSVPKNLPRTKLYLNIREKSEFSPWHLRFPCARFWYGAIFIWPVFDMAQDVWIGSLVLNYIWEPFESKQENMGIVNMGDYIHPYHALNPAIQSSVGFQAADTDRPANGRTSAYCEACLHYLAFHFQHWSISKEEVHLPGRCPYRFAPWCKIWQEFLLESITMKYLHKQNKKNTI